MKGRARKHKAIEQGNRQAYLSVGCQCAQHPARCRAVKVEHVATSSICRRNHYWVTGVDEPDMTDESFIQNLVDNVALVSGSLGQAFQNGSLGRNKRFVHFVNIQSLWRRKCDEVYIAKP